MAAGFFVQYGTFIGAVFVVLLQNVCRCYFYFVIKCLQVLFLFCYRMFVDVVFCFVIECLWVLCLFTIKCLWVLFLFCYKIFVAAIFVLFMAAVLVLLYNVCGCCFCFVIECLWPLFLFCLVQVFFLQTVQVVSYLCRSCLFCL